ncbi:MAG TPA: hypothetical protein VGX68_02120 [Thermoanaerobaculia bacterium]|jgi:hypothetical protein|nr:hypothetical protein [Thermoanaerobaculia bacterium]
MSKKLIHSIVLKSLACLILVLLAACSPYASTGVGPDRYSVSGNRDWDNDAWYWVPGARQLPPHQQARLVPLGYSPGPGR